MPYKHALPSQMAMASSTVLVMTVAMGLMFEQSGVSSDPGQAETQVRGYGTHTTAVHCLEAWQQEECMAGLRAKPD